MDVLLLHALAHKGRYRSLNSVVPKDMISQDTQVMLAWFGAYYNAFPEREFIVVDELESLIRLRSGAASPEQIGVTLALLQNMRRPIDEHALNGILGQLYELDLAGRSAALIKRYEAGEEVDLAYELNKVSTQAVRSMAASAPDSYCDTPIETILAEIADDQGVKFRKLSLLRENIMGLHGGVSIAVGARPDKGKTSMIASMITDFAPQIEEYFGPGRPILWMNNEGTSRRIVPRVYQAALEKDLLEITSMSNAGTLVPAYTEAVGGVADIIRIKDMHGASLAQAEQVIESMRPAVVVWDMLANFRLAGSARGGNKADEVEQMWQETREMAVRHDFISLCTVQISAEGGNMLYPPYSALKDSKTGIQGATDIIVMMGSLDNPDAQSIRGLSTPKNKFACPGKKSYVQGEVYFDGSRCKFDDGSGGAACPN